MIIFLYILITLEFNIPRGHVYTWHEQYERVCKAEVTESERERIKQTQMDRYADRLGRLKARKLIFHD